MSIEAMKRWLEAFKWALDQTYPQVNDHCLCPICKSINELSQAIEQAQKQEPVAWIRRHPNGALSNEVLIHVQVEPVRRESGAWVPLYTSPPQRQPLDDEEIRKAKHHMVDGAYQYSFMQGVRYAEHKHGITGEQK